MIILDGDTEQLPKLADPAPTYAPVNRCTTPTSSLPDYDASEAQLLELKKESWSKWNRRRPVSRCWRILVIFLLIYTFLTMAIGIPLLVVKLRHHPPIPPPSIWNPQQASVIIIPSSELVNAPPEYNPDDCDKWSTVDQPSWGSLASRYSLTTTSHRAALTPLSSLNYSIPVSGSVFFGSNASFNADSDASSSFHGNLLVDVNDDSSAVDIQIFVNMSYTDRSIRNRTHVCNLDSGQTTGLYIYVPNDLDKRDKLGFDIKVLLPQPNSKSNFSNFATMLPMFQQHYGNLSPKIQFEQIFLGGPMSTVVADSVSAENLVVMSSPGNISGSFEASYQLVLETMSASIDADIVMTADGDFAQPTIRLNTGNGPIDASISLVTRECKGKLPMYYIDANTFSAPLTLSVSQSSLPSPSPSSSSSTAVPVFVHAGNNLGETRVYMDEHYEGTFIVQTEYAGVLVSDTCPGSMGVAGTDSLSSNSSFAKLLPDSVTDGFGRTLFYDNISDSAVSGWVGRGKRPKTIKTSGAPGCVEVNSVLSHVQLELGSS
ncbi:hypothetical protein K474DRAFT_1676589 [Panus rudis PR-1116 ss-1]|nr:hypothetical protein K474DRAFT_1676589 [Panus rudis PR-1116 ss-1]